MLEPNQNIEIHYHFLRQYGQRAVRQYGQRAVQFGHMHIRNTGRMPIAGMWLCPTRVISHQQTFF